jgi:hypothetical protein
VCGFFKEKRLITVLKRESMIEKQIVSFRERIKWTKDVNNIIIKGLTTKEWNEAGTYER